MLPQDFPSKGHTLICLLQGGEKYQQAFYVFEELAQAPATSSVRSLVSQAVAELHLGRTEEAQAALDQALKKEPKFAEAIANLLVLNVIAGKDGAEQKTYVSRSPTSKPVSMLTLCLVFSKPQTLNTLSWWTWRKRVICLTRRRQSTAPRSLRRLVLF